MKKGKKLIALIVGVLMIVALAITVAACGEKEDGVIDIGVINNNPTESGYRAANDADLKKWLDTDDYNTTFVYTGDQDEQITAFNNFVADRVDYIVFSPAEADGWGVAIEAANKAGVNVIVFDRMTGVSTFMASVTSNMMQEGLDAVNWLKDQEAPEGGWKVLHIQGAMGSTAQIGRSAALYDAHNDDDVDITIVNVQTLSTNTSTITGGPNWTPTIVKTAVGTWIGNKSELDFNVVYSENTGMAEAAMEAIVEKDFTTGVGGDTMIMAFDYDKWGLEYVLSGDWNFVGQCNPLVGEYVHNIIQAIEAGKNFVKEVEIQETWIDADTIDQAYVDAYGLGPSLSERD